jgi:2,3-bisphosphoglycerate-independent phosphoglycerate mutase
MNNRENHKVVLLILDGWGLSAAWNGNAIKLANPANYNYLWQTYPHWALKSFDQTVNTDDQILSQGLGYGVISSGRFLSSVYSYIQNKLDNNEITHSSAISDAMQNCKNNNSALHLCGLVSDNKNLSHFRQIIPIIRLAKNIDIKKLYLHLILDSDSLNDMSQLAMISEIEKEMEKNNLGKIASVSGRNWSLDGEANFERIIQTYRTIALGEGRNGLDVKQILQSNLERNVPCENITPTAIIESNKPVGRVNDFDSLIFFNFDDKSLRSLTSIFIGQDKAIRRKEVYNVNVVTFSDYFYIGDKGGCKVAFKRDDLKPNLPHLLLENNKSQLYLVSDIKYEHLSFYFYGGDLETKSKVDFKTVSSNNESCGLRELVTNLIQAIKTNSHSFIAAGIGNCDYIAHCSKIKHVADSVKEVDSYLGEIEMAALDSGYTLIISSDHGFIEQLANLPLDAKAISHSKNPVPAIIIEKGKAKQAFNNSTVKDQNLSEILSTNNSMQDIAPTILKIFEIDKPVEMRGSSLI